MRGPGRGLGGRAVACAQGWAGRLGLLLAGLSLGALAVRLTMFQASKGAQSARRYIDGLCDLEPHALNDEQATGAIPLRKEDRGWRELCQRVRQRLAEFAHRAEELEMARAAAEVRVRRIVAERDQLQRNPGRTCRSGHRGRSIRRDRAGQPERRAAARREGQRRRASGPGSSSSGASSSSACWARPAAAAAPRIAAAKSSLPDEEGKQHWYRVTCRTLASADEPAGGGDRTARRTAPWPC